MGIATVCRSGFLDDLRWSYPSHINCYSASHSRRTGRSMCVHMEGTSPAPKTLRGPDIIGTRPASDSRRRPKRASHGRAYGLDDTLPYCNMTLSYDLFSCIIGTPIYTIEWFAERHKQNAACCLGQKFSLLCTRYFSPIACACYIYSRGF